MQAERFKSVTGKDVRISSTSGHVVVVGSEFTHVPAHMVNEAMAQGLLSESVFAEAKRAVEQDMAKTDDTAKKPRARAAGASRPSNSVLSAADVFAGIGAKTDNQEA